MPYRSLSHQSKQPTPGVLPSDKIKAKSDNPKGKDQKQKNIRSSSKKESKPTDNKESKT